jgi:hypothetical protein
MTVLFGADGTRSTGYLHRQYAASFAEVGTPRELPACGGWLIERTIPGSTRRDAMGCYPLFDCPSWTTIDLDLAGLAAALVSVTLVTDPFADVTEPDLMRWFNVVVPYKRHYVADLSRPPSGRGDRRHARNVRRAVRQIQVDTYHTPLDLLDDWCALYRTLIVRHDITGIRAFSRAAFAMQFRVPGLVMFRATADDEIVGLHLWYARGEVAYGHLGATSERGYELMASYALYEYASNYFRGRVRWLDLGGVAGLADGESAAGLRQFKAGWATDTKPTFLCGRILQPEVYERLSAERVVGPTSYFPAYRVGEFGSPQQGQAPSPR